jgi:hypothetical protein
MVDHMEPTVSTIFRKYLDWCVKHRSSRTAQWYQEHLASFLAHCHGTGQNES